MEHAVHLGAGHFISDVSPMSAKAVLAKVKKMKAKLRKENPDLDLDELDALLEQDDSGDEEDDGDDEGDEKIAAGDAVGKGLALINQVSFTLFPPRLKFTIFQDPKVAPSPSILCEDLQGTRHSRAPVARVDTHQVGFALCLLGSHPTPAKGT
jgi:hypothetical protein